MGLNTFLVNPSSQELEQSLRSFEASSDVDLHPVVRECLSQMERGLFRVPFLSSHGTYLFGCLFTPSSSIDGRSDLTRIGFIASHDASLFLVSSETNETQISDSFVLKLRQAVDAAESSASSVIGVIEASLNELISHLNSVENELGTAAAGIERSVSLGSKRANMELASCQSRLGINAGELVNVEPIIDAMCGICTAISEDRLDIRDKDRGEMFGGNLEIRSSYLADRSNQLLAAARGASRLLAELQIGHQARMSELRIRANQLLAALATLFISPVILLNVYSQFLAEGQSLSNSFTANYFWVVIVGLVSAEAAFFRAKKWLR
jgi:hypothetical protein